MTKYKQVGGNRVAMTADEEAAFTASLPSAADILTEKRSLAKVSRSTFFINVWKAGILTKADALIGARGDMPTDFTTALATAVLEGDITQAAADEAEILLAGATQVDRTNSYIALMRDHYTMTDAQVDALFGIT